VTLIARPLEVARRKADLLLGVGGTRRSLRSNRLRKHRRLWL